MSRVIAVLLERIIELLKIKSIVTFMLTFVFCKLSLSGVVEAEAYMTIFSVIISFYFGTQYAKASIASSQAKDDVTKAEGTNENTDIYKGDTIVP